MRRHLIVTVPSLLLTFAAAACGGVEPGAPGHVAWQHQAFTSPKAMLANMTFDGEAVVDCG